MADDNPEALFKTWLHEYGGKVLKVARAYTLTAEERAALLAFLGTLSSEQDPQPPTQIVTETVRPETAAVPVTTISQHEKQFSPTHVSIKQNSHLWILNNDTRTHNVRVFDPKFDFDSGGVAARQ